MKKTAILKITSQPVRANNLGRQLMDRIKISIARKLHPREIKMQATSNDSDRVFHVSLHIMSERNFMHGVYKFFDKRYYEIPVPLELNASYTAWQKTFIELLALNEQRSRGTNDDDDWDGNSSRIIQKSLRDVENCRSAVNIFKTTMQEWFDSEEWQPIRKVLSKELQKKDAYEAFRVIIQAESEIWEFPWTSWDLFQQDLDVGIGFSLPEDKQVLFKRNKSKKVLNSPKIRILSVFGYDENLNLKPDREVFEDLDDVEPVFLDKEAPSNVIKTLRDRKGWDIFVFAGHSNTEDGEGKIYFNENETLGVADFANAVVEALNYGLKIVILNSCQGIGLATKLAELSVPVIFFMQGLLPDRVGHSFLKKLITEYRNGESLDTAFRRARGQLEEFTDLPGCPLLPAMYQNHAEIPPTWKELLNKGKTDREIPPPPQRTRPKPKIVLRASIFLTMLVMGVRYLGILQPLELAAYDQLLRMRPPEGVDPRIVLVAVTDKDIQNLDKNDPISDATVLEILKKVKQYQPAVIGLDIYRDIPVGSGSAELREFLEQNQDIIGICRVAEESREGAKPPPGIGSENLGFGDLKLDVDRVIRRHLLALDPGDKTPCQTYLSLSFQLVADYLELKKGIKPELTSEEYIQLKGIKPELTSEEYIQLGRTTLKHLPIDGHIGIYQPIDDGRGYQIMLNYHTSNPFEHRITIKELRDEQYMTKFADVMRDKIVIIGYQQEEKDLHATPDGIKPGLIIQAHQVSQLLSAVENDRNLLKFWSPLLDIFWIGFWSFLGSLFTLSSRHFTDKIIVATVTVGILFLACFLILLQGIIAPFVPTVLSLLITSFLIEFLHNRQSIYKRIIQRPYTLTVGILFLACLLILLQGIIVPFVPIVLSLLVTGLSISCPALKLHIDKLSLGLKRLWVRGYHHWRR